MSEAVSTNRAQKNRCFDMSAFECLLFVAEKRKKVGSTSPRDILFSIAAGTFSSFCNMKRRRFFFVSLICVYF